MCDLDACEWRTIGLFGCYGVSKNIVIIIIIITTIIITVFNKSFNLVQVYKRKKMVRIRFGRNMSL